MAAGQDADTVLTSDDKRLKIWLRKIDSAEKAF